MKPTVSIVTPSYNQAKFIERTIERVLSQDYPNIEYIVVDGGSTDGTLEILRRYEDRLKWISEKDRGQAEAINKGFRMSRGEILAWLNSDDVYLPGAVSKAVKFLVDHPDVMMVYGEGYMIDDAGNITCRFPHTEPRFDLAKLIYESDYILQQSTFIRKSVFDSIGMLDESLHWTLDWDLWIRIAKRFSVGYVPEYLGCIRVHHEAKSMVGGRSRFREIVRTIRKHGMLKYPRAYLNYAYDTYGKSWLSDHAAVKKDGKSRATIALVRKSLRWLATKYYLYTQQDYYSDGWVGKRAIFVLPKFNPVGHAEALLIQGELHMPNVPLRLKVSVNDVFNKSYRIDKPGGFTLQVSLPLQLARSECFHVRITNNRTFTPRSLGVSSDDRDLGFLLTKMEIK